MKKLKKLVLAATSLTLMLALSAFTACGDGNENNSSSSSTTESSAPSENANAYKFTVLNADGSPAANKQVLLCDLVTGICLSPVTTDSNGVCYYEVPALAYAIHVINPDSMDMNNNYYEHEGPQETPAEYDEITLTLKN